MTDVPVDDPETLRRILADTEALLLDFDGPICSVFAGFPADVVADQLRDLLAEGGYRDLPDEVARSEDPFHVLKYAASLDGNEVEFVEASFRAHEVEAVGTAKPTSGAHALIRMWKSTGRKLAIVSNNSIEAIETYLRIHDIFNEIDFISARDSTRIELLKPNPYLASRAVSILGLNPCTCTLIGDSITDIEAAQSAGIRSIAYANKAYKFELFNHSHAQLIVGSIALIGQSGLPWTDTH